LVHRPAVLKRPGVPSAGVNSVVATVRGAEGAAHRHGRQARRRLALAAGIFGHEPEAPAPGGGEGVCVVLLLHAGSVAKGSNERRSAADGAARELVVARARDNDLT